MTKLEREVRKHLPPGYTMTYGGKHMKVRGPSGLVVATVSVTPRTDVGCALNYLRQALKRSLSHA